MSDRNLKPKRGCYIPNLLWINILPQFYNFRGRNLRWRERTLMIPEEWKEEQLRARPCSAAWSLVTPVPQFTRKWALQSVLTSESSSPFILLYILFSLNPMALTVKMRVIYNGSHLLWEKTHRISGKFYYFFCDTISKTFVILLFTFPVPQLHSRPEIYLIFYFTSQIMLIYNCPIWVNE